MPVLVWLVSHNDVVHVETLGTLAFGDFLRGAFQLGFRNGGGHWAQRDLSQPRAVWLDRGLRHNGVPRSRGRNARHTFYAAHDGLARATKGMQRLLDTGV